MISVDKTIDVDVEISVDDVAENLDMYDAKELMSQCDYGPADVFDDHEIMEAAIELVKKRDIEDGDLNLFLGTINMRWDEVQRYVLYRINHLEFDDSVAFEAFLEKLKEQYSTFDLLNELNKRADAGDEAAQMAGVSKTDKMKIEAMDLISQLVATVIKGGE